MEQVEAARSNYYRVLSSRLEADIVAAREALYAALAALRGAAPGAGLHAPSNADPAGSQNAAARSSDAAKQPTSGSSLATQAEKQQAGTAESETSQAEIYEDRIAAMAQELRDKAVQQSVRMRRTAPKELRLAASPEQRHASAVVSKVMSAGGLRSGAGDLNQPDTRSVADNVSAADYHMISTYLSGLI
jgi:flagellar biosynthesis GTPase FlhF